MAFDNPAPELAAAGRQARSNGDRRLRAFEDSSLPLLATDGEIDRPTP